jgi:hypothetical protein
MPMIRDDHENLLNELVVPDLEQSRRTEILGLLRNDYTSVLTDFEVLEKSNDKFQKDNNDLIISNSQLFRQAGIVGNTEKQEEIKEKEFSETITLESLEK